MLRSIVSRKILRDSCSTPTTSISALAWRCQPQDMYIYLRMKTKKSVGTQLESSSRDRVCVCLIIGVHLAERMRNLQSKAQPQHQQLYMENSTIYSTSM